MDTLTDLYNEQIVPLDQELEKQASVMVKQAEEEEFAGRIMARGFADELNKLAAPMAFPPGGTGVSGGSAAFKAQKAKKPGGTQMAEAPKTTQANFKGSTVTARKPQTRQGAMAHAKGIANMAKGVGGGLGGFGAKKPARLAGGPPKL
jgi:hypothetical protein